MSIFDINEDCLFNFIEEDDDDGLFDDEDVQSSEKEILRKQNKLDKIMTPDFGSQITPIFPSHNNLRTPSHLHLQPRFFTKQARSLNCAPRTPNNVPTALQTPILNSKYSPPSSSKASSSSSANSSINTYKTYSKYNRRSSSASSYSSTTPSGFTSTSMSQCSMNSSMSQSPISQNYLTPFGNKRFSYFDEENSRNRSRTKKRKRYEVFEEENSNQSMMSDNSESSKDILMTPCANVKIQKKPSPPNPIFWRTPKKKKRKTENEEISSTGGSSTNFLNFMEFKRGDKKGRIEKLDIDKMKTMLLTRSSNLKIIDCRYDYEFSAGHFQGAIRCTARDETENLFQHFKDQRNLTFIFHCELSLCRGPRCAEYFVHLYDNCPHEEIPRIYLLVGGYSKFWFKYRYDPNISDMIKPIGYVRESEKVVCKLERTKSRESWNRISSQSLQDDEDPFFDVV